MKFSIYYNIKIRKWIVLREVKKIRIRSVQSIHFDSFSCHQNNNALHSRPINDKNMTKIAFSIAETLPDPFPDPDRTPTEPLRKDPKVAEISSETRKLIDEMNENGLIVEDVIDTILEHIIQEKHMNIHAKVLEQIRHYLAATAKQRGWKKNSILLATSAILDYADILGELLARHPRDLSVNMQRLTEEIY